MTNQQIKKAALKLLLKNRKTGYASWAKKEYEFSCPSLKTYPYQWFWDSCFHIIVLSILDIKRAEKELLSLLSMQQPDGFIPHVIFWRKGIFLRRFWCYLQSRDTIHPCFTGMIQPPVLGIAAEVVFEKNKDVELLKEILPKLEKYFDWLRKERDPDEDNLISIISPYESGLDYAPHFDEVVNHKHPKGKGLAGLEWKYRKIDIKNKINRFNSRKIFKKDYFNVEDVLVNSIYAESLKAVSRLFAMLKQNAKAEEFYNKGVKVGEAIINKCFDIKDDLFYSLYSKNEFMAKTKTVVSLLPIMIDEISSYTLERVIKRHLLNEREFWLPYPIPTTSQDEPSFDPEENHFIWRGPTWINTNWFVVRGLRKHGYKDIAEEITQKSKRVIEKYGFWEYFNPLTGEGYGAKDFGWSTLIVDILEKGGQ